MIRRPVFRYRYIPVLRIMRSIALLTQPVLMCIRSYGARATSLSGPLVCSSMLHSAYIFRSRHITAFRVAVSRPSSSHALNRNSTACGLPLSRSVIRGACPHCCSNVFASLAASRSIATCNIDRPSSLTYGVVTHSCGVCTASTACDTFSGMSRRSTSPSASATRNTAVIRNATPGKWRIASLSVTTFNTPTSALTRMSGRPGDKVTGASIVTEASCSENDAGEATGSTSSHSCLTAGSGVSTSLYLSQGPIHLLCTTPAIVLLFTKALDPSSISATHVCRARNASHAVRWSASVGCLISIAKLPAKFTACLAALARA